jgi:uncharacterized protein YjbI with pentapeptide repeats
MKIKNLTPFLHGAKVTSRAPPRPEMTLVVRARFHLSPDRPVEPLGTTFVDQGRLTADVLADDDEERSGELLYPSDFADFKPRADVMLRGTCHPNGAPVTECDVRFAVGAWSKTLRVTGIRAWSDHHVGAVMSRPLAFSSQPIGWSRAFGGPGFAANPIGRGLLDDAVPNIELPSALVRSRGDRPAPAGFGPINPAWPERASKVGRAYDGAYRRARWPYYAEDFDWSHFNAAPRDQQLEGYLRGDEELVFENLHPRASRFTARLPGLRLRALVHDRADRYREPVMVLDTLFADLDREELTLTYRGLLEVEEDDLTCVRTILIASEPLAEAPRSVDEYRARLDAFARDPMGFDEKLTPEVRALMEHDPAKGPPVEPLVAWMRANGGLSDADEAHVRKGLARAKAGFADDARASLPYPVSGPPPAPPVMTGGPPPVAISDLVRLLKNEASRLQALPIGAHDLTRKAVDALLSVANDPRLAAIDPAIAEPPPAPPGPSASMRGADLRGRDLTGLDLSGADLTGANLEGAKLTGANLSNAKLERAVLFKADLSGANLDGAALSQANASGANLARATLRKITATQVSFEEADLQGASLEGATFDQAIFRAANLTRASAEGASFARTYFDDATLEDANFRGVSLSRCRAGKVRASRVDLRGALLDGTSFVDADLTAADLREVKGLRTSWIRAVLRSADLRWAVLPSAFFDEAILDAARVFGADLRSARFYRASIQGADLARSNLFGADLRKARLNGSSLRGANLYDAKLIDAGLEGAILEGANLKRSTLEVSR